MVDGHVGKARGQFVHVEDLAALFFRLRVDVEVFEQELGDVVGLEEPLLLCVRHVENLRERVRRQAGELEREGVLVPVSRIEAVAPGEVVDVQVLDALRTLASPFERLEHGGMVGGLVHVRVFTLHVEDDGRDAIRLGSVDERGHRGGLAAAGCSDDARVAWEDGFVPGIEPGLHLFVPDHQPQAHVAADAQHASALRLVEQEDGALRPGPEAGRLQRAFDFLSDNLNLRAPVIVECVRQLLAVGDHANGHGGVGGHRVRFREGAPHDDAQVGAVVFPRPHPDQRLGREQVQILTREQHGDEVVLAGGDVEVGESHRRCQLWIHLGTGMGLVPEFVELVQRLCWGRSNDRTVRLPRGHGPRGLAIHDRCCRRGDSAVLTILPGRRPANAHAWHGDGACGPVGGPRLWPERSISRRAVAGRWIAPIAWILRHATRPGRSLS